MAIKIALQLGLIPGSTVADRQRWAADHGVEGIEISAGDYPPDQLDQARRDFEDSPVPISTVCGNTSFDFLDLDATKRLASIEASAAYLRFCGQVGAVGQIVPPIFGGRRLPDLSPLHDAAELEMLMLGEVCRHLGDIAGEAGTLLLLEPLNRYEQHLLRRLDHAVDACRRIKHPAVKMMADFFHMSIEETNTPRAIRRAKGWLSHVHLADNTRLEPGSGDLNFLPAFRALAAIDYSGYLAYECGLSETSSDTPLIHSIEYVRGLLTRL